MNNTFEHDATPTWSGFIYQGEIAVYLAVKKICELRDKGIAIEVIGSEYKLEVEKCEDISIIHETEDDKKYLSIHQVKHQKDKTLSKYQNPLVQLMLEKGFYQKRKLGNPDAFLHVSENVCSKNKVEISTSLAKWHREIQEYYNKFTELAEDLEADGKKEKALQELIGLVSKEPIKLERKDYKKLKKIISAYGTTDTKTNEEIKDAVFQLKKYMDEELSISSVSDDIKFYVYEDGNDFCKGTEIFKKIVERVKEYKADNNSLESQYEYIADKLLTFMRNHVLLRHQNSQRGKNYKKSISFLEIIGILDDSLENFEKEANIFALKRLYEERLLQYCDLICEKECLDKGKNFSCNLEQTKFRRTDLENEPFTRLCYSMNPDCSKTIQERECLNKLMNEDGLNECVFKVFKNIPEQFFCDISDRTKYVINNQEKNALVTAISSSSSNIVIHNIVNAIQNNAALVSPIFDADQLITTSLEEGETIWNTSYSEIQDNYMNGLDEAERNQNSICNPKKPEFIKAENIIKEITDKVN